MIIIVIHFILQKNAGWPVNMQGAYNKSVEKSFLYKILYYYDKNMYKIIYIGIISNICSYICFLIVIYIIISQIL